MTDFDDRSGIVACETDFGRWYQTTDDVCVEVFPLNGVRAKQVACIIRTDHLRISVPGRVIEGRLHGVVHADESCWTVEDGGSLLRVTMPKANATAANCWPALFAEQLPQPGAATPAAVSACGRQFYPVDPMTFDLMQRKLTLQRFQYEHPGFDFSGASITGSYQDGGPQLPDSSH